MRGLNPYFFLKGSSVPFELAFAALRAIGGGKCGCCTSGAAGCRTTDAQTTVFVDVKTQQSVVVRPTRDIAAGHLDMLFQMALVREGHFLDMHCLWLPVKIGSMACGVVVQH